MLALLTYVHLLLGLGLVLFVLLQDPKGGAMGVFSGGSSSNSFFGSSGASNFLTTTTKWIAVLFALTSLTLTYWTANRGGSIMDSYTAPPAATAPAEPAKEGTEATPAQPATDAAKPTETPKQ